MAPRILIIDDNDEILRFLSGELKEIYEVITAPDGIKALSILKNDAIHLVVSDVMMPEMDGFELCRKIKTNFELCHIPVVLLTAKKTMEAQIEGLETGADAYISKPFSPKHLKVQIANLLANRNKLREYFTNSPLAHINSMAHSKADEIFLENLNEAIRENLEDTELDVEKLSRIMAMSRPTLYRKIKAISELTPIELINLTRLKKAAELINEGLYKTYEISDMVGYTCQKKFSRNFLKQFGMTPTEYISKKQAEKTKEEKAA
ncbi:MAG TPA: response regulator [Flavisolibacter sp.]|nr:response regulator [Flavisolibacter sp.]